MSVSKPSQRFQPHKTPVDPRLYQHLERLGLGAESTRRPPKGQRRRKQRVTVDMDQVCCGCVVCENGGCMT